MELGLLDPHDSHLVVWATVEGFGGFFCFGFCLCYFLIAVTKCLLGKQRHKERRVYSALWFEGAVCHDQEEMVVGARGNGSLCICSSEAGAWGCAGGDIE